MLLHTTQPTLLSEKLSENEKLVQVSHTKPYLLHVAQPGLLREKLSECATDFSLLNLPKGKSLGRSKPATNS